MGSDNLQIACVQPPISLQIRWNTCIAIYSIHWYSRGAESDDQTFEKHWINNWQTELNILYIKNEKILYSILTS